MGGAPGPAAAPGSDCDATIVPVVSGHVDSAVLDQLTAALLSHDPALARYGPGSGSGPGSRFGLSSWRNRSPRTASRRTGRSPRKPPRSAG